MLWITQAITFFTPEFPIVFLKLFFAGLDCLASPPLMFYKKAILKVISKGCNVIRGISPLWFQSG